MLTKEELNELMVAINLDQFVDEVKKKNETRGRKPKEVVNYWRGSLFDVSYSDLNPWVDDVLTGSGRLDTGNSKVSGELVFALLKGIPCITTAQIKSFLNRKRVVTGDFVESDRYCQWLATVMISAMKSLDYHLDNGKKLCKEFEIDIAFDVNEDAENYEEFGKDWCKQGSGI
ncbi:hypothetical protein CB599_11625 [Salmonella enterica subsp. enterica serovar Adjame]|nr:hypothetical protein [Salmonella enterica subsp. enterica serovar Adjame]